MISLIICSRYHDIAQTLKDNISETIGVDYELIVIDNSENKYSIFSAYNEGIRRAKGDLLCFMHEDILYHTNKWGEKLINHFNSDSTIGLIGVVGTHFLPKTPSYWCDTEYASGTLIQGYNEEDIYKTINVKHDNFLKDSNIIDAVAVDGFWFSIKRNLFDKIKFDEKLFKGFHFYEMDICMQVLTAGFSVKIIMDIEIEHFSYGNGDKIFDKARTVFFRKWKKKLPIVRGIILSDDEIESITKMVFNRKLNQKKSYRFIKNIYKRVF